MDCIAFIEKEGLKHRPNLGISPMFAEDVCNVLIAGNMAEFDQACSNSFTDTVIGECDMPFGKARVRDCGTLLQYPVFRYKRVTLFHKTQVFHV